LIDLISRIGQENPQLIVYPAVVGQSTEASDQDAAMKAIFNTLQVHSPDLVSEVQLLVGELERITTLWEEQWLGALQTAQSEAAVKLRTLKAEIPRLKSNTTLSDTEKVGLNIVCYSHCISLVYLLIDTLLYLNLLFYH
jgi:PI-3-kinase-related kinase SMG-1